MHRIAMFVLGTTIGCSSASGDGAATTEPDQTETGGAGGGATNRDAGKGGTVAGSGGAKSTGGATGAGGSKGTGGATSSTGGATSGTGGATGTDGAVAGGGGKAIILDTDMASDVDDAGALAILHALADNGEARILGVVCSTDGQNGTTSIPFIDIVNTYYGHPDIPIGLWPGDADAGSTYTGPISADSATFPHDLGPEKSGVPVAFTLMRKLLAAEPDNSVTIVTIGPMFNEKDLLASTADENSPLNGHDLVAKKVHELVVMGGTYPTSGSGAEWNFYGAERMYQAVTPVLEGWPTPIMFDGSEIGFYIATGGTLPTTPANNPVRKAYELYPYKSDGKRASFDPTAVLYGVRGLEDNWTTVTGYNEVTSTDGANLWHTSPDKGQSYLKSTTSDPTAPKVAAEIDALLVKPPGVSSR